jgi:uncharacterized radical SAM superfamily Fe-S cluster-containing enzyme
VSPYFPDLKELERSLSDLAGCLKSDKLVVLGGEPTLNRDLPTLLDIARASGISGTLSMITNGLLLKSLPDSVWKVLDQIEISIYPSTSRKIHEQLNYIYGKSQDFSTNVRLMPIKDFNSILLGRCHGSLELATAVFQDCYYKRFCRTVHKGKFFICAPCINAGRNSSIESSIHDDGIEISSDPNLVDKLKCYLDRAEPLKACFSCAGTSGSSFSHQLMRGRTEKGNPTIDLRSYFHDGTEAVRILDAIDSKLLRD